MSRFKKDPYATLSARHHALKLLGQMERTETGRAAWYTQPTNQASAEYSLSCPCHHLRKNIIFESDLALRVGQAANLDLIPASGLLWHINTNAAILGTSVTAVSEYFSTSGYA